MTNKIEPQTFLNDIDNNRNFNIWTHLYDDFLLSNSNGELNHQPLKTIFTEKPKTETQSVSLSCLIKKVGIVNNKLGILYAYTSRNGSMFLLGYGSINHYNDARQTLIATINYQPGDKIRFLYVYPQYPYNNNGEKIDNLANVPINVVELCIDSTTIHPIDGSGTVSFMDNNTVMIPTGNLILNYPWEPFSFKTLNYPDPELPTDPEVALLDNIDTELDTNLSKLDAILYNINITKSAILDVKNINNNC